MGTLTLTSLLEDLCQLGAIGVGSDDEFPGVGSEPTGSHKGL